MGRQTNCFAVRLPGNLPTQPPPLTPTPHSRGRVPCERSCVLICDSTSQHIFGGATNFHNQVLW